VIAAAGSPKPGACSLKPDPHPLANKTVLALATMLALLAAPYASPRLRALRVVAPPWERPAEPEAAGDPASPAPAPAFVVGEQKLSATENSATVTNALPATHEGDVAQTRDAEEIARTRGTIAIEDPQDELAPFYASLARTLKHEDGAVTRVLHYGDSVIAGDLISGTMRRRLQERFGDAGHGFILIANPWEWYFQNDIAHSAGDGWSANKLTGPWPEDHLFGLGGVSFHTHDAATAFFSTRADGDYGRKVSRFDLYYLAQPRGGDVMLSAQSAAGSAARKLSTRADAKESRVESIEVPDGHASLTIRTLGNGDVRLFGVALERDRPGVTYDALGAHAARASFWSAQDPAHWADQLRLRKPSLVIVQFGTNESEDTTIKAETYEPVFGGLLDEIAHAAPGTPILVASPLDRAIKGSDGELRTTPVIERIIAGQRAAARARGIAFWNTFEAMGGRGTMAKWRHTRPQLGNNDLSHPTPAGAEILGNLFSRAVFAGYEAWASRHPGSPALPEPQVPPP
jgi:lysophospholipase L1-like esterase